MLRVWSFDERCACGEIGEMRYHILDVIIGYKQAEEILSCVGYASRLRHESVSNMHHITVEFSAPFTDM